MIIVTLFISHDIGIQTKFLAIEILIMTCRNFLNNSANIKQISVSKKNLTNPQESPQQTFQKLQIGLAWPVALTLLSNTV